MSLDRFLAVVYPISSRSLRNERNALKAITILWVLILSSAIPVIFAHGVVVSRRKNQQQIYKKFFFYISTTKTKKLAVYCRAITELTKNK